MSNIKKFQKSLRMIFTASGSCMPTLAELVCMCAASIHNLFRLFFLLLFFTTPGFRHPNTGLALDTVTGSESHAITNDQRETLLTMLNSSQDVNV